MRSGPSTRLALETSPPQQPPFLPVFLKTPAFPQTQVFSEAPDFPETPNLPWNPQPLQGVPQESPKLLPTPHPSPTLSSIVALPLPVPSPPSDPEQLVLWGEHR